MAPMRKGKRGGPRKGAGRKPIGDKVRRHRVVVLLNDLELMQLQELAERRDLPVGTAAYELVAGCLKRRKRTKSEAARED